MPFPELVEIDSFSFWAKQLMLIKERKAQNKKVMLDSLMKDEQFFIYLSPLFFAEKIACNFCKK